MVALVQSLLPAHYSTSLRLAGWFAFSAALKAGMRFTSMSWRSTIGLRRGFDVFANLRGSSAVAVRRLLPPLGALPAFVPPTVDDILVAPRRLQGQHFYNEAFTEPNRTSKERHARRAQLIAQKKVQS